jgi:carboxyl-terminal processing protease
MSIVEQIRRNHFVRKDLNDTASSQIFDKYLSYLDPGRSYLLLADVQRVERHRYQLDEALRLGNLEPAFEIYNVYHQRVIERLESLIVRVGKDLSTFDFEVDDRVQIDRKDSPWPASVEEIDALWERRLKASILSMKLNGKELTEIQELLVKRYRNRLKQTKQVRPEDAFQAYVNAFASTYDPHTQYLSPRNSENFNMSMSLSLEGIGAVLRMEDEYTSVVRLVPAGPADKANELQPSDRIIAVGQGKTGKLIDVVGWRLDDVVELIRGPKDTLVRLEIDSGDEDTSPSRTIEIVRNTVKLEEQAAQKKLMVLNDGSRDVKIGVIEVPTFYADFAAMRSNEEDYKSTTRDVKKLIEELKLEGIEGLVVDLRDNGGGSLQEAQSLTGLFIRSGPTVQVKTTRRNPNVYADNDGKITWEGPMAVVVNRLSASASEIFAGAIQDYQRGIILGTQTFGKGTVQTIVPLRRGQLKITQAKFYRVSGESTQHQGVLPDIEFPSIFDKTRVGESALDDALAWDTIRPAMYSQSNDLRSVLSLLRNRHIDRVADNPDFTYLRALSERNEKTRKRTHLSLNELVRTQEKEEDDSWRLELENARLMAKGEDPVASLDELEERQNEETDEDETEDEPDALVTESGNVLIDFMRLRSQVVKVSA